MHLIDHPTLAELSDALGDELGCIVQLYAEGLPAHCAELVALLAAGDLPNLRRSAHSLKGSSVSMGANQLGALAAQIEKLAASGQGSTELDTAVASVSALGAQTASALVAAGWVRS